MGFGLDGHIEDEIKPESRLGLADLDTSPHEQVVQDVPPSSLRVVKRLGAPVFDLQRVHGSRHTHVDLDDGFHRQHTTTVAYGPRPRRRASRSPSTRTSS
jgi:hypothetical protein